MLFRPTAATLIDLDINILVKVVKGNCSQGFQKLSKCIVSKRKKRSNKVTQIMTKGVPLTKFNHLLTEFVQKPTALDFCCFVVSVARDGVSSQMSPPFACDMNGNAFT